MIEWADTDTREHKVHNQDLWAKTKDPKREWDFFTYKNKIAKKESLLSKQNHQSRN